MRNGQGGEAVCGINQSCGLSGIHVRGLFMGMDKEVMCDVEGPEVEAFKNVCHENDIWDYFFFMEYNPDGNPYNTGLIIDNKREIKLNYQKLHPWVLVKPWRPVDVGLPVCEGSKHLEEAKVFTNSLYFITSFISRVLISRTQHSISFHIVNLISVPILSYSLKVIEARFLKEAPYYSSGIYSKEARLWTNQYIKSFKFT